MYREKHYQLKVDQFKLDEYNGLQFFLLLYSRIINMKFKKVMLTLF